MRYLITIAIVIGIVLPTMLTAQTSVVATSPAQNGEEVAVGSSIQVIFSDELNPASVTASTAKLFGSVVGTYSFTTSYDGVSKTLTVSPDVPFRYGELINLILTAQVEDVNSNAIQPYVLSFQTKYIGGAGTFTQTAVAPVGNTPEGIGAIDLDGDHDLDFVVANYYSSSVSIFENTGNGTLAQRAVVTIGSRPQAVPMAVGDFDGDGDNDFVVPCRGSGYVSVFTNNGGWSFSVYNISIGGAPIGSIAGDIDADGDLDLILGNLSNVQVYSNNGSGVFTLSSTLTPAGSPHSPSLADIDGDGDLDISIARYTAGSVVTYSNNGAGVFSLLSTSAVGAYPRTVEPADYDLDGDIDLAVANSQSTYITLLWNDGSGAFTSSTVPASPIPHTTSAIDVEGDGDLDLLISNGLILENDGSGGFSSGTGSVHEYPIVGDIDGDGDADIARVSNTAHVIRILLNDGSPQPPVADAGIDASYECSSIQGSSTFLDGSGSYDPNGTALTYGWYENNVPLAMPSSNPTATVSLPVGVHTITLVVTNEYDLTASDDVMITISDNTAPVIAELEDIFAPTDAGVCYRSAQNLTLLVPSVEDACSANISLSNDAPVSYPRGTTVVTWTAEDDYGNTSTQSQIVTIYDDEAPQISVTVSPSVLFPPNHQMVAIGADVTVSDNCTAEYTLKSVTSNEPDNGLGDGDTVNDIQFASFGTMDDAFSVRAERSGAGSGRVYTVVYEAVDEEQNSSTSTAYVYVPHSAPKSVAQGSANVEGFALLQNYPNPFSVRTSIRYQIPSEGLVSLKVYNVLGTEVAQLTNKYLPAGAHAEVFERNQLPAGIYLCRLEWNSIVRTTRLVVDR